MLDNLQADASPSDDALDLERCLQRLPAEQRAVLLLVTLEDLSYEETARILAIPVGTVMSRLSRARSRLRALMDRTPAPKPAPAPGQPRAAPPQIMSAFAMDPSPPLSAAHSTNHAWRAWWMAACPCRRCRPAAATGRRSDGASHCCAVA